MSTRELTGPERALWELQRRLPYPAGWNQALAAYVIGGQLSVPALNAALDLLVRRHPALRTRFAAPDGTAVASTVAPGSVAPRIPVRGPGHGLWPEELRTAAGRPFDLTRDSPLRVTVLRFRGVDTVVLTLHRMAGDGWTAGLLYEELAAGYGAFAAGAPMPAELAGEAETHVEFSRAAEYWQHRLDGVDPTHAALAVGRGDPPIPTFAGALLAQPLGPAARDAVPALARELGVAEEVVLLAAYFALLAYHRGGPDLVVGVDVEPVGGPQGAGYRTGMLPVRAHVDMSATFAGLAGQLGDLLYEAVGHRPAPPEAALPEPAGAGGRPPLIRHAFRVGRRPAYTWLGDLPTSSAPVHTGRSWQDLAFDVVVEPTRTEVRATYRSEILDDHEVRALAQRYDTLLCQAAIAPNQPLATMPWRTSADRALEAGARRRQPTS